MGESIVELARREADETEAAIAAEMSEEESEPTPEPEPDTEPDTEPEPNLPPEPPSEKMIERALTMIEKAGDAYTRKVQTIQETTPLGLSECPLCPVPGFVSELPPPEGFQPEQVAAVMHYLGLQGPHSYRQAPHLDTCPDCDGEGFWSTGSKRDGYKDVSCDTCMGNGFVDQRHALAMRDAAAGIAPYVSPPMFPATNPKNNGEPIGKVFQGGIEFSLIPGGSPDQYGRLAGNPLWGQPREAGGI